MKEPQIQFIDNRRVRVLEDFQVSIKGYIFRVPEGYVTDGASIPKLFWGFPFCFTPFEGKTLPAALVHDHFYSHHYKPKYMADWAFYQILKKYKVPLFKRVAYFVAVRLFGRD